MEGVGQDLFPPPGYANSTTPLFATPVCGSILQTEVVSTVGAAAVFVPFIQLVIESLKIFHLAVVRHLCPIRRHLLQLAQEVNLLPSETTNQRTNMSDSFPVKQVRIFL